MSTLEQLVPTLDLCQQLKAAGFPQDTYFFWFRFTRPEDRIIADGYSVASGNEEYYVPVKKVCAAPTAGELEEWLSVNNLRRFITAYYEPYEPIERRWSVASDLAKKPEPNLSTCWAETLVAALAALVLEVAG